MNKQVMTAKELLKILRDFVKENKDIYPHFNVPHLSEQIKVSRREKKKAWAVSGIWYGKYCFVSDVETYIVPDLMISDPKKYKEERVEFLRLRDIGWLESRIKKHKSEITKLENELEILKNI